MTYPVKVAWLPHGAQFGLSAERTKDYWLHVVTFNNGETVEYIAGLHEKGNVYIDTITIAHDTLVYPHVMPELTDDQKNELGRILFQLGDAYRDAGMSLQIRASLAIAVENQKAMNEWLEVTLDAVNADTLEQGEPKE